MFSRLAAPMGFINKHAFLTRCGFACRHNILQYDQFKDDLRGNMRTEKEMLELITKTAKNDPRIRAVIMNGSRANPAAPRDRFQDYDIIYIVNDIDTFTAEHNWIDIFGKRLILQMPETMSCPFADGRFIYLMLFEDGNRIDLQLIPIEKHEQLIKKDSESILLLDKDGIIPPFPPASDSDYYVKPPDEHSYYSCCNNFWWCMQNVAKGILRDELPYAMRMLNAEIREDLNSMIEWYIGVKTRFTVSAGKAGKYFKKYLSPDMYKRYSATYTSADYDSMWQSVLAACGLFSEAAQIVASHFGYCYPIEDEKNMLSYMRRVRSGL